ncbi:hypothetical protein BC829DRAFT_135464 [Chytridium lagenaria]|nr:hypothetical protein BC829DRAFT_135464 [Chytridium lagenaria]
MLEKMAPKRVRKRRLIIICAALLILFLAVPSRGRRGLNNIPPAVAVGADTNAINGHQHDIDMNEDSSPSMDDDDAGLVAEENDLQQQTQQHYNLKDDQGRPPPLPQPHHQQQQQPILNANILERHPPSHNNPVQEEDDSDNDDGPPPAPAIPNNFDQQHQPLNKDVDKKPRVDAFGRVRKPPSAEDTEPNDVDGEVAKIDGKFEPLHHQEKGENEKVVLKIHERQSDEREEVLQMDDKDGDDIEEEPQRDVEKKDVEEGECQRSEDGLCLNKALEKPDEAQNDSDKIQLPVKDDDIPLDKAPHHLNNDTITPDSLKWRFVCIIGNSQRIDDALRSHKMWGSIFPSFWYIWGKEDPTTPDSIKLTQSSTSDPLLQTHFHIYRTPDKKTWSQGIAHLLPLARQKYACEYIFTHDDDLDFSAKDRRPLHEVLVTLLATHQPAVAGFPWTVGDQSNDGTRRIEAAFNESDVAPLAYFDSGMVLYHHSIVDLFIPYAPRGEGGFHGDWSLCAHFLNLFAPFTFKGAAVRFNALTYRNMISLDNVPVDQRAVVEVTEEGLAVHEGSRHPYEYVFNKKYMAFLSSGMHGLSVRWGRGWNLTMCIGGWKPPLSHPYP